MKKVIFLDIDGTLIYNHGTMSEKVKYALSKVRENGHYVFLCTGRNRTGVEDLMKTGYFDGTVCSAGGYIELDGKKIYEAGMLDEDVKYARRVFEENHILYNMEANFHAYQSYEMTKLLTILFEHPHNSEVDRMIEEMRKRLGVKSLEEYNSEEKIQTIVYFTESKEALMKAKEALSSRFHFLVYQKMGDVYNGELMREGVDKGSGIKKVMECLNIPLEHSIGFGDSMNDLEMIETCAYSVVMANGDDKLKAIAKSICESVENDGIYHELKRLGLI